MINAKVLVQVEGRELHGRVVGQSFPGHNQYGDRVLLMVELVDQTIFNVQPEVQRTLAEVISGHKHVWVSEADAQTLLGLGLLPTQGGDRLRSKAFGTFNGVKVNVDTALTQGEYYTLDGKKHRV